MDTRTTVKVGEHITYELYPHGRNITAIVEWNEDEQAYVAQATGEWKERFDNQQVSDYVRLEDIGREVLGRPAIVMAEAIARGKREILDDMGSGIIPHTVRRFAALHDYVDANEYGFALEAVEMMDEVQTALDTWLLDDLLTAAVQGRPNDLVPWLNKIHRGDCIELMGRMSVGSIDLIVTSPPYNIKNSTGNGLRNGSGGKWPTAELIEGYDEYDDTVPYDEYVEWQRACLTAMMRQQCQGRRSTPQW